MYAIIEACGRQYKVEEGMTVYFEKLNEEEGKKVTFYKVVLISNNGKVEVGTPVVEGAKVEGKVVAHGKGKKIIVFKMKPKKNYRRKQGHRQPYTKVEITAIKSTARKPAEKVEEKPAEKPVKKTETTKKAETTKKVEKTVEKAEA